MLAGLRPVLAHQADGPDQLERQVPPRGAAPAAGLLRRRRRRVPQTPGLRLLPPPPPLLRAEARSPAAPPAGAPAGLRPLHKGRARGGAPPEAQERQEAQGVRVLRRRELAAVAREVAPEDPADLRGHPEPEDHGEREGAPEDAEPERGVREPAQEHPDPAVGQAVQDPDAQAGRQVHRLPVPHPVDVVAGGRGRGRRPGERLLVHSAREAEQGVQRLEDGGRSQFEHVKK